MSGPDEHAVLIERDGRSVLRFERLLPHTPERVWATPTEPDKLAAWHPSPFLLEPRVGGAVRSLPTQGIPVPPGRVLAFERGTLLAHTLGEDELRWTLEPRAEGCLLTL